MCESGKSTLPRFAEYQRVPIYIEDWAAAFGSPYQIDSEQDAGHAELVEDGDELVFHSMGVASERLAFVDGVRRVEALLYTDGEDGKVIRGIAGAHACGVVLSDEHEIRYGEMRLKRLIIWGSGLRADVNEVVGGWQWDMHSIASDDPQAPMNELQERMRIAESELAEATCARGYLTIVDGPLRYIRNVDQPIVGYIKTHYRALLPPEHHVRIPRLTVGQRSSAFHLHGDRYSVYARLGDSGPFAGPWSGIVRLEIPQTTGLKDSVAQFDRVTGILARFAGVAHCDPRAPQNLQPVFALEKRLRHLLGDQGLAVRAIRTAVAQTHERQPI